MTNSALQHSPLILVDDVIRMAGDDRRLRADVAAGRAVRLIRGAYVEMAIWTALTPDERYLLRIRAVDRVLSGQVVFSHHSAAAIWGYPILGRWPTKVHIIVGGSSGQRSSALIARHAIDVDESELEFVDELLVTSPLRTLCDVSRTVSFAGAVALFDSGLHSGPSEVPGREPVQREEILERLHHEIGGRGLRSARAAAQFADSNSGSTGESLSRVLVHKLRMPRPQLQVPVKDAHGILHHSDFGWEESLGEFDGRFKYSRNKFTNGHPPEEVVWAEKLREDAMRAATGKPMVRWVWDHLTDLRAFERILRGAGIRPIGER